MRTASIAGAVVLLVWLAGGAIAADSPKVDLDAESTPIAQAMSEVGNQAGVQILCDSDVKGAITGHFTSIELDKLLDAITKQSELTWQKLYLRVEPDKKATLEQAKAGVKAVATVTGGPVVVCDPVTGKQKVFVEQDETAPSVEPEKLGLTPVYLISKPKVEADSQTDSTEKQDVAARLQSLQNERTKLLSQLTSEERIAVLQQEMMSVLDLDPATRQQMMLDEMMARHNMDPQMRDAYRDAMRETWQVMRERGLIPDRGPDGPRRGRDQ